MQTQTFFTTPATAVLSDSFIPAVKGEFYDYDYKFVSGRPIFALLKCKASKGRALVELAGLGSEANILFYFGEGCVRATAIQVANKNGDLGHKFEGSHFGVTYIGKAQIGTEQFHEIRGAHDVNVLVSTCRDACSLNGVSGDFQDGDVMAVITDAGKYGLFLIQEASCSSVMVNACHILL